MAKVIKYICDKCKKEFALEDKLTSVEIPVIKRLEARGGIGNSILAVSEPFIEFEKSELCSECNNKYKAIKNYTDTFIAKEWEYI